MSTFELPPLGNWDDFSQFENGLLKIHQAAAPGCEPGFYSGNIRHANEDGSYSYFPHVEDREQVLRFAHSLWRDADARQRPFILPVGVLAAHPFKDGNGRTSRVLHAKLVGKSDAEIASLRICGPRLWLGGDAEAQAIIDLRPPQALIPFIEDYVYESEGVKKQITFDRGYTISNEGAAALDKAQSQLSKAHQKDLDAALSIAPFNDRYFALLQDPESIEFALNIQNPDAVRATEEAIDLTAAMARLGAKGLERFVDDMWRFRLLRAQANIACLGNTALGSRIVTLPDHATPLTITDHYIRLTNNLTQDQ